MRILGVFSFLVVGVAIAASVADQGKPGTQGPWPVTISGSGGGASSGTVSVDTPCNTVVESVRSVGVTALSVPATAQVSRKMIIVCNSPENASSPILKCRGDGTTPVIGVATAGQALGKGDCVTYSSSGNPDAGTSVVCISDTAATAASATECK